MDAFEVNLQTFLSTTHGDEMRDSLGRCFNLIYTEIKQYSEKIQELTSKITELEKGG